MTDTSRTPRARWRVVDLVVASVLAVAAGLLLALWNTAYAGVTAPLTAVIPGLEALLYGIWLLPGVLVGLVVRRPGAALYGELVAATVSWLVLSLWGPLVLLSGLAQGVAAELVFALFLYRAWGLVPAILAGAAAGLGMAINDTLIYFPAAGPAFIAIYAGAGIISGAVIAGVGSWLLTRALAATGVLSRFAAGREAGVRV